MLNCDYHLSAADNKETEQLGIHVYDEDILYFFRFLDKPLLLKIIHVSRLLCHIVFFYYYCATNWSFYWKNDWNYVFTLLKLAYLPSSDFFDSTVFVVLRYFQTSVLNSDAIYLQSLFINHYYILSSPFFSFMRHYHSPLHSLIVKLVTFPKTDFEPKSRPNKYGFSVWVSVLSFFFVWKYRENKGQPRALFAAPPSLV